MPDFYADWVFRAGDERYTLADARVQQRLAEVVSSSPTYGHQPGHQPAPALKLFDRPVSSFPIARQEIVSNRVIPISALRSVAAVPTRCS